MNESQDSGGNRLSRGLQKIPTDLASVAVLVLLVNVLVRISSDLLAPIQVVAVALFLLFVPGYVFLSILFPRMGAPGVTAVLAGRDSSPSERIDVVERAALSFGMSVCVVPLFTLAIAVGPWSFAVPAILQLYTSVLFVGLFVALVRRLQVPPEERFGIPWNQWRSSFLGSIRNRQYPVDALLNLGVALGVLLAIGTLTYALAVPNQGTSYSSFYLVTENESGEFVATDYPTKFSQNQPKVLTAAVDNRENQQTTYTVVIALTRVETNDTSVEVLEWRELRRIQIGVDPGTVAYRSHTVTPTMTGQDLRLEYYLYKGDPPEEINADTAYRHLYLWIDVAESNQ